MATVLELGATLESIKVVVSKVSADVGVLIVEIAALKEQIADGVATQEQVDALQAKALEIQSALDAVDAITPEETP